MIDRLLTSPLSRRDMLALTVASVMTTVLSPGCTAPVVEPVFNPMAHIEKDITQETVSEAVVVLDKFFPRANEFVEKRKIKPRETLQQMELGSECYQITILNLTEGIVTTNLTELARLYSFVRATASFIKPEDSFLYMGIPVGLKEKPNKKLLLAIIPDDSTLGIPDLIASNFGNLDAATIYQNNNTSAIFTYLRLPSNPKLLFGGLKSPITILNHFAAA